MSLCGENEMLRRAENGKYAVGIFFALTMNFIKPIVEAAEEENSPVIISYSPEFLEDFGIESFSAALRASAQNTKVPVCLHMDHGFTTDEKTIGQILKCMQNGWTSVQYDASMKPLDENIRETQEVTKLVHAVGNTILGSMGTVPRDVKKVEGYEVPEAMLTKPEEAERFVRETKVDSLAIAVGQFVHPLTLGEPRPIKKTAKIDFERIKAIRKVTNAHLILQGGTHISDDSIKKAMELGVSGTKVAAELAIVWVDAIRKFMEENPDNLMPPYILKPGLLEVKRVTSEMMRLFGSSEKAW